MEFTWPGEPGKSGVADKVIIRNVGEKVQLSGKRENPRPKGRGSSIVQTKSEREKGSREEIKRRVKAAAHGFRISFTPISYPRNLNGI